MIFKKRLYQSVLGPARTVFGAYQQSFPSPLLGIQLQAGSCCQSSLGGHSWERAFALLWCSQGLLNPGKGKWALPSATAAITTLNHVCLIGQLGSGWTSHSIWVFQSQAEEVRSQAGVTEVIFHVLKKHKIEAYIKTHYLLWKKSYM